MTSRYYEAEHFAAYERIRREGLDQWSDLFEPPTGYHAFPTRTFLTRTTGDLPRGARVLEYGCGTGAAACFLAQKGFRVDAVDLVPDAIELARAHAERQGLEIDFQVADVCRWTGDRAGYDAVVDSFCLQSIVLDEDRSRLYAAVHDRLLPTGRYLIVTAMFDPDRDYGDEHYDAGTGIVWSPSTTRSADTRLIDGRPYLPNRRHLTAAGLCDELGRHGFEVVEQGGPAGGEVVARPA